METAVNLTITTRCAAVLAFWARARVGTYTRPLAGWRFLAVAGMYALVLSSICPWDDFSQSELIPPAFQAQGMSPGSLAQSDASRGELTISTLATVPWSRPPGIGWDQRGDELLCIEVSMHGAHSIHSPPRML
jgi:hypothetical protein